MIKPIIKSTLASLGLHVKRAPRVSAGNKYAQSAVLPNATYSPWLDSPDFAKAYRLISRNTLVDIYRCWEIWHLVEQLKYVDGDFVEVGVWRGGSGCLTALRAKALGLNATIHLCDTFSGVVGTGEHDPDYKGGEHSDTSRDIVIALAKELGLDNVAIRTGIFPDETGAEVADLRFRMCHIDVDVYLSGLNILEWVWGRLNVGGIVLFDDYGFSTTAGVTRLVNELGVRDDRLWIHNLNGHAVLVKLR